MSSANNNCADQPALYTAPLKKWLPVCADTPGHTLRHHTKGVKNGTGSSLSEASIIYRKIK